jgi:holliday junction DNA helicase RuvA
MISSLKGKIERVSNDSLEIEVNGIGYLVYSPFLANKLRSKIGEEIKVFTFMAVSENDISLFAFESYEEVDLFKMLISVSGVGPKIGSQILADTSSESIIKAIGAADVSFFEKIKGIGKKTAQRVIIDLKSKVGGLGELDLSKEAEKKEDELWMSLKQLGFDNKEIEIVVKKVPIKLKTIEERLSWCLSEI